MLSLNDLLNLSVILLDDNNKEIEFNANVKRKISIFNFKTDVFLRRTLKLRPTKSTQQTKEEQVNFLLEFIEKNLEEYKSAIELRDKQLPDTKRIPKGAKVSYDNLLKENKQLKEYILGIKQRFQKYQKQQEEQKLLQDTQYFKRPQKKNIKK